jgi:predicted outer membrane protein
MRRTKLALSIIATVLGAAACNAAENQSPPQDPTTVTMTTGAEVPVYPAVVLPDRPTALIYSDVWGSPVPPLTTPAPTVPSGPSLADHAQSPPEPVTIAGASTPRAVPTLTDAEIVSVLESAAVAARQQAREAAKRTNVSEVRLFAERILADDSHAAPKLERVERSASTSDSAVSAEIRSTDARALEGIRTASPSDLDKIYVDAQVGEERHFLDLLDSALIPQAKKPELKKLLQECRVTTSRHLGGAETIQSSLTK